MKNFNQRRQATYITSIWDPDYFLFGIVLESNNNSPNIFVHKILSRKFSCMLLSIKYRILPNLTYTRMLNRGKASVVDLEPSSWNYISLRSRNYVLWVRLLSEEILKKKIMVAEEVFVNCYKFNPITFNFQGILFNYPKPNLEPEPQFCFAPAPEPIEILYFRLNNAG